MARSQKRGSVSPLVFVGALLAGTFLVLIGVSMAQEFRRRYVLQQHVRVLRDDIAAKESRIQELQRLREYLRTDEYVERLAREKLNYQKPGERVVVVPQAPTPSPAPALLRPSLRGPSPARSWFLLLFGPTSLLEELPTSPRLAAGLRGTSRGAGPPGGGVLP